MTTTTIIERPTAMQGRSVTAEELELLEGLWAAPAMEWDEEEGDSEEWVLFVVIGLSYAAALAYAAYCTSKGGSPSISFGWTGFKVSCIK